MDIAEKITGAYNKKIGLIGTKISEKLDINFNSSVIEINTFDEFCKRLLDPFLNGKRLFYRGERICSVDRRLVATMFRNNKQFSTSDMLSTVHVDSKYIYDYYSSMGGFVTMFNRTFGGADCSHLYELCAFAQHYLRNSPLIDFSKSLYPSLSFALKGRSSFDNGIVLYVIEIKDDKNYTDSIKTADKWLSELNLYVSSFNNDDMLGIVKPRGIEKSVEHFAMLPGEIKNILDDFETKSNPDPIAKIIDVPTNTRMKFQNGVFLLLDDFHLVNGTYFTKNIRRDFTVEKYLISRDVCPALVDMINNEAPWYNYENLTDIEGAFDRAIKKESSDI